MSSTIHTVTEEKFEDDPLSPDLSLWIPTLGDT
jgi:hypothetical protein